MFGGIPRSGDPWFDERFHEYSSDVIRALSAFCSFDPWSENDQVFALHFWNERGAKGIVFPTLQRYLNSRPSLNEVLKACEAMLIPLGELASFGEIDVLKLDNETVAYVEIGGTFKIQLLTETVTLYDLKETGIQTTTQELWTFPDITTLGQSTGFGADGSERSRIMLFPGNQNLYTMDPHNVDIAPASLSLVLPMARLAHNAIKQN